MCLILVNRQLLFCIGARLGSADKTTLGATDMRKGFDGLNGSNRLAKHRVDGYGGYLEERKDDIARLPKALLKKTCQGITGSRLLRQTTPKSRR
jgi:hypothetical protein